MSSIKRAVRRPLNRRRVAVGIIASGALLLAGCGSNDDMDGKHHQGKASPTASKEAGARPAPGAFNASDVTFAQSMIPHHQQAVEMAELADGRASDARIKTLAAAIEKAQDPEIKTMRSWLKAWGKPESPSHSMPGMHHGSGGTDKTDGMAGMMTEKDMTELKAAKGKAFDKKFAQMMIGHHNGAITMAKDERKNGRNATAKKLAGNVITHQAAEVDEMNKILDRF
ncbi:DUF305 domain-containing protein [Streptomyces sp. NPDC101227]|uniref:DUF305 domain-containing protein n=1 Tax=Streptomyces sp. NPDC101227 TaxID=3366136 RepID=UPI0038004E8C